MQNKLTYNLFRILILFYVLWGAHAWFTWGLETNNSAAFIVYGLGFAVTLLYHSNNHIRLRFTPNIVIAFSLLFVIHLYTGGFSGSGYLTGIILYILRYYPLLVLVSDIIHAEQQLEFMSKVLAWILIPGLALYFIMLFLPVIPGIPIGWEEASDSYIFFNYFVLLRNLYRIDSFRFSSIFLEPSYLATMCVFLLYASKYNFKKWENLILAIATLVSISLAGYVIGAIGYVLIKIIDKQKYIGFVSSFVVVLLVYQVALNYNGGNNLLNTYIIERLELDEEKGIAGNKRTVEEVDILYDRMASNGSIWKGIGYAELEKQASNHGAGYKMIFVRNGIITAIMLLLFYWFVGIAGTSGYQRKFMLCFLLLYILMFIPNANLSSYLWFIPFVLAAANKIQNRQKNEKHRYFNIP